MAKKKSKTQKYKKNLKKKMNKTVNVEIKTESNIENTPIKEKQLVKKDETKPNSSSAKSNSNRNRKRNNRNNNYRNNNYRRNNQNQNSNKKKQLENKVKNNNQVSDSETINKLKNSKESVENKNINKEQPAIISNEKSETNDEITKKTLDNTQQLFNGLKEKLHKDKKIKEKVTPEKKKTIKNIDNENGKKSKKRKNIFIRLLYEIVTNIQVLFNAALIMFFVVLLVGMIRIEVLSTGTIIYISCIVLFLLLVALSYTKYISGKILTIILCTGMGFAIYHMQYTYDFVRNLASNVYEYKTYYVVTFDNGLNKSIYTINNKSVGLLKDNCINIERRLNTKLDGVNYLEYDDINLLFEDFYASKYRAILVNENQYKYLQNNIQGNSSVKILYEFKVNEKK